MAKERNSGLGRGLDSLIPKIEEQEVEEGVSLEDLLKNTEEEEEENEIEKEQEPAEEELGKYETVPADADKELVFTEDDLNTDDSILVEESDVEKYEEEISEEEVDDEEEDESNESSQYTNVFFNDDAKAKNEKIIEEKMGREIDAGNIDSTIKINEEIKESVNLNEATDNLNDDTSLLSEKEEKLVYQVIETVESNPRITLWSARSAAVLRYLRKTEPEFSISNEASNLIDKAIAEKYPEIWTLFNHL